MILDKKGKLFGKISVVDLFVILVIIIGIAGFFFTKEKLDNEKILSDESQMIIQTSAQRDKLEIKLTIKEVRDITRDAIVVGDEVYQVTTGKMLGTVSQVESKPSEKIVKADNGEVYSAVVPERYDVTIVVETDGKQNEEGYYTDTNIQLLYGREMEIKTTTVQTTPIVTDISVVEATK